MKYVTERTSVALAAATVEAIAVPSSFIIVPVPVAFVIVAFTGLLKLTLKVSFGSTVLSPVIEILKFCFLVPGLNVNIPDFDS